MKVLQEIQTNFISLYFCPSNSKNPNLNIRNLIFSVSCFIAMIIYHLASGAYIKRNLLNNFESCLLATVTCSGALGLVYMMIVSYVLRYKIGDIFYHFQDIYDNCKLIISKRKKKNNIFAIILILILNPIDKNLDSGKFMQKANERSAQTIKYGMYFMCICSITTAIMIIISLIYSFLKFGYANIAVLYRPFNLLWVMRDNWSFWFRFVNFLFVVFITQTTMGSKLFIRLDCRRSSNWTFRSHIRNGCFNIPCFVHFVFVL